MNAATDLAMNLKPNFTWRWQPFAIDRTRLLLTTRANGHADFVASPLYYTIGSRMTASSSWVCLLADVIHRNYWDAGNKSWIRSFEERCFKGESCFKLSG
ncbi:MAG: hypothetical protein SGI77_22415 [Pirellulaceae bacterium]|nr:hypothetical protein [Pirellulaceae bacterium]